MPTTCPVCATQVPSYYYDHPNGARITCPVCGTYRIMEQAEQRLHERRQYSPNYSIIPDWKLSAALREQAERGEEPVLRDPDAMRLAYRPAADPLEVVERILRYLGAKGPAGNTFIPLTGHRDCGVAGAESPEAFDHALGEAATLGYIQRQAPSEAAYRLTMAGWKHLRELPDVDRQELLPLADQAMRVLYDQELHGRYSPPKFIDALGVDDAKAARVLRYAKKQGWIDVRDVYGSQMPVGVSLTRDGMQYVETLLKARPAAPPAAGSVYYFHGPNARVNNNSVDASVNVVNNYDASALLEKLTRAVSEGVADERARELLLQGVRQIQVAPDPETRRARIAEFLQSGANFMTILSPFVPELLKLAGLGS